jgi:hypothetical protein
MPGYLYIWIREVKIYGCCLIGTNATFYAYFFMYHVPYILVELFIFFMTRKR